MKVRLKRIFSYQASPTKVVTHGPGIVDLPERYALSALRQRLAVRIESRQPNPKKGAPENKVRKPAANKAAVGKKTKRGRSTRSKS